MTRNANASTNVSRRGFLDYVIAVCSAVSGMVLAIPGLLYLWPAARGGRKTKVEVPGAAKLAVGEGTTIQVGNEAVILVRASKGYRAYSAVCTHLGCLVKWEVAHRQFRCPCHAGVFDQEGNVVSGPPPAPLKPYAVKEIGARVFVMPV